MKDLTKIVATTEKGAKVDVEIWRSSKVKTLEIEIGRFEEPSLIANSVSSKDRTNDISKLGLTLSDELEVVAIDREGPSAKTNIQIGEVIDSVNNVRVNSLTELRSAISEAVHANKTTVLLRLNSDQRSRFIAVTFNRA